MEIVIMEWMLWAYPLAGCASALTFLPVVKAQKLGFTHDPAGWAGASLLYGAVWPIATPWLVLTWIAHRREWAAEAADRERVTASLEQANVLMAYDVVRRHEDAQREERDRRNQRLREQWEQLAGIKTYARPVGYDRKHRVLNRVIKGIEDELRNRRTSGS